MRSTKIELIEFMDIFKIILSKQAENDLKRLPAHITLKLQAWVNSIQHEGLRKTQQLVGYHDEALKGKRKGQRSIRLG